MNNETKIKTDLPIKANPEIISKKKELEDLLRNNNIKNNVIKE